MLFPHTTVIGIGLIGGSFALAAKRAGLVGEVIGVARSETTRALAVECGAADHVTADAREAVREADLVYLATPVSAILSSLAELGPCLKPGALVTDAGSTKVRIVAAAEALPTGVAFVGGHPMAGSEHAVIGAARDNLFQGATYFLTPTEAIRAETFEPVLELVHGLGAEPVVVDAELHDQMVALTSHLPHALAWALCAAAARAEAPEALAAFTAGAWRDTTRVAESPEEVWADIFLTNPENLAAAARGLRRELDELLRIVEGGDRPALLDYLARSREAHQRIAEA
jgi:prephenate dehydrogenase